MIINLQFQNDLQQVLQAHSIFQGYLSFGELSILFWHFSVRDDEIENIRKRPPLLLGRDSVEFSETCFEFKSWEKLPSTRNIQVLRFDLIFPAQNVKNLSSHAYFINTNHRSSYKNSSSRKILSISKFSFWQGEAHTNYRNSLSVWNHNFNGIRYML